LSCPTYKTCIAQSEESASGHAQAQQWQKVVQGQQCLLTRLHVKQVFIFIQAMLADLLWAGV
jgi:hypothetical protein|tara:strand:- start:286 stop:471 length:186 start_codon:yes stop_codon:yes gene_type:complete